MNATELIKSQLQQKRAEVERLHEDIEALERTLKILEHQNSPGPRGYSARQDFVQTTTGSAKKDKLQKDSIPWWVQSFLRDNGKPMSGDEIISRFAMRGKPVKKTTVMGALYRWVKKKQVFTLPKAGTFGLIEWEGR